MSRARWAPPTARPSTRVVASSIGRNETSLRGRRGPRTSRATFRASTPRRTRKRNQLRSAASLRATEAGSRPRPWRCARKGRTVRAAPPPAPGAPLDELARAPGLGARDAERHRLGRPALGVPGAGDELAEAAVLDDHRLAARRARLVGRLVLGPLLPRQGALLLAVGGRPARGGIVQEGA